MYGYIRILKPELKFREYDDYRACYCGLCEALHRQYGSLARCTISYDMTFLVLLLSGLYEPNEELQKRRCIAHPFCKQLQKKSAVIDYAADMSLLLYREKCIDDWNDERKFTRKVAADFLSRDYKQAQKKYPQKTAKIQTHLQQLHHYEKAQESNPDLPAGCFGAILGEIFAWKEDIWKESLFQIGFFLGKFVYLLDAYDDLEKDQKKNCYNPLRFLAAQDADFPKVCEDLLRLMASSCAAEFERLPILKYADILRNILYAGIWTRFYTKKKQEDN